MKIFNCVISVLIVSASATGRVVYADEAFDLLESKIVGLHQVFRLMAEEEGAALIGVDQAQQGLEEALARNDYGTVVSILEPLVRTQPQNQWSLAACEQIAGAYRRLGEKQKAEEWAREGAKRIETLVRGANRPEMLLWLQIHRRLLASITNYSEEDYEQEKSFLTELLDLPQFTAWKDLILDGLCGLQYERGDYKGAITTCDLIDSFYGTLPPSEKGRLQHEAWRARSLFRLQRHEEAIALLEHLAKDRYSVYRRELFLREAEEMRAKLEPQVSRDLKSQADKKATTDNKCGTGAEASGLGSTPFAEFRAETGPGQPLTRPKHFESKLFGLLTSFQVLQDKELDELGSLRESWLPGFKKVIVQNDPQALLDYFLPVMQRHPTNLATYGAYERIGMAYSTLGKPAEGNAWLRKGMDAVDALVERYKDKPESVKILAFYFNLYHGLSDKSAADFDRVKQKYTWALKQPPYSEFNDCNLFGLANLYMAQSQYEEALASCAAMDAFYETQPPEEKNRFRHYLLQAEALRKLDRNTEALQALKAAKETPCGSFDEAISRLIAELAMEKTAVPPPAAEAPKHDGTSNPSGGSCCQKPSAGEGAKAANTPGKSPANKANPKATCTCGEKVKPGEKPLGKATPCCPPERK